MKKLLITVMALAVVFIAQSAYVSADEMETTTVSVTVGGIFELSLATPGSGPGLKARSAASMTFKSVDGTSPSGWYYNILATPLDGNGDPTDGKSDVALIARSNMHSVGSPYLIKIKKAGDSLNSKLGYYVDKAFDAGAPTETQTDGTVTPGTGFAGTVASAKWGELPTASVLIYTSGANYYATYGALLPVSFALVPGELASGGHGTTITYTMVSPV